MAAEEAIRNLLSATLFTARSLKRYGAATATLLAGRTDDFKTTIHPNVQKWCDGAVELRRVCSDATLSHVAFANTTVLSDSRRGAQTVPEADSLKTVQWPPWAPHLVSKDREVPSDMHLISQTILGSHTNIVGAMNIQHKKLISRTAYQKPAWLRTWTDVLQYSEGAVSVPDNLVGHAMNLIISLRDLIRSSPQVSNTGTRELVRHLDQLYSAFDRALEEVLESLQVEFDESVAHGNGILNGSVMYEKYNSESWNAKDSLKISEVCRLYSLSRLDDEVSGFVNGETYVSRRVPYRSSLVRFFEDSLLWSVEDATRWERANEDVDPERHSWTNMFSPEQDGQFLRRLSKTAPPLFILGRCAMRVISMLAEDWFNEFAAKIMYPLRVALTPSDHTAPIATLSEVALVAQGINPLKKLPLAADAVLCSEAGNTNAAIAIMALTQVQQENAAWPLQIDLAWQVLLNARDSLSKTSSQLFSELHPDWNQLVPEGAGIPNIPETEIKQWVIQRLHYQRECEAITWGASFEFLKAVQRQLEKANNRALKGGKVSEEQFKKDLKSEYDDRRDISRCEPLLATVLTGGDSALQGWNSLVDKTTLPEPERKLHFILSTKKDLLEPLLNGARVDAAAVLRPCLPAKNFINRYFQGAQSVLSHWMNDHFLVPMSNVVSAAHRIVRLKQTHGADVADAHRKVHRTTLDAIQFLSTTIDTNDDMPASKRFKLVAAPQTRSRNIKRERVEQTNDVVVHAPEQPNNEVVQWTLKFDEAMLKLVKAYEKPRDYSDPKLMESWLNNIYGTMTGYLEMVGDVEEFKTNQTIIDLIKHNCDRSTQIDPIINFNVPGDQTETANGVIKNALYRLMGGVYWMCAYQLLSLLALRDPKAMSNKVSAGQQAILRYTQDPRGPKNPPPLVKLLIFCNNAKGSSLDGCPEPNVNDLQSLVCPSFRNIDAAKGQVSQFYNADIRSLVSMASGYVKGILPAFEESTIWMTGQLGKLPDLVKLLYDQPAIDVADKEFEEHLKKIFFGNMPIVVPIITFAAATVASYAEFLPVEWSLFFHTAGLQNVVQFSGLLSASYVPLLSYASSIHKATKATTNPYLSAPMSFSALFFDQPKVIWLRSQLTDALAHTWKIPQTDVGKLIKQIGTGAQLAKYASHIIAADAIFRLISWGLAKTRFQRSANQIDKFLGNGLWKWTVWGSSMISLMYHIGPSVIEAFTEVFKNLKGESEVGIGMTSILTVAATVFGVPLNLLDRVLEHPSLGTTSAKTLKIASVVGFPALAAFTFFLAYKNSGAPFATSVHIGILGLSFLASGYKYYDIYVEKEKAEKMEKNVKEMIKDSPMSATLFLWGSNVALSVVNMSNL